MLYLFGGGCVNNQSFADLEAIRCRAARLIYNLPKDTPSTNVRQLAHWVKFLKYIKPDLPPRYLRQIFS